MTELSYLGEVHFNKLSKHYRGWSHGVCFNFLNRLNAVGLRMLSKSLSKQHTFSFHYIEILKRLFPLLQKTAKNMMELFYIDLSDKTHRTSISQQHSLKVKLYCCTLSLSHWLDPSYAFITHPDSYEFWYALLTNNGVENRKRER